MLIPDIPCGIFGQVDDFMYLERLRLSIASLRVRRSNEAAHEANSDILPGNVAWVILAGAEDAEIRHHTAVDVKKSITIERRLD